MKILYAPTGEWATQYAHLQFRAFMATEPHLVEAVERALAAGLCDSVRVSGVPDPIRIVEPSVWAPTLPVVLESFRRTFHDFDPTPYSLPALTVADVHGRTVRLNRIRYAGERLEFLDLSEWWMEAGYKGPSSVAVHPHLTLEELHRLTWDRRKERRS